MIIDSHAHLHTERFADDIADVLQRAADAGVRGVITLGTDLESSHRALELARRSAQLATPVLAAAGVHPQDAAAWRDEDEGAWRALWADPLVPVIGEIGVDHFHYRDTSALQRRVFRRQLALARELHKPVSIHCREAYPEMLSDLEAEYGGEIGGVCHCFSGTDEDAARAVGLGFRLGVGGSCTYPKSGALRETLRRVGLRQLMLETDSPYLPPQPVRGKRNEPGYLTHVVQTLAELLATTPQDVMETTSRATREAFRVPKFGTV